MPSDNSTSTNTGVSTPSTTSTQLTSTPTSSSVPPSSSSLANSSPSSTVTTDTPSTSSTPSSSTSVSLTSSSTSQQPTTSTTPSSTSSITSHSTTSTQPQTSSTPSTTSQPASTTSTTPTSSSPIIITQTSTNAQGSTTTVVITSTAGGITSTGTSSSTSSSSSAASTAGLQPGSKSTSSGLSSGGTIAVAVVVPIVAVALIVLAALYFWRKRKARKDAEELRRKEVEEYGYNPNNDPTLPAVGGVASPDGAYEMREEGSGYRGWGTTAVASSGRKASTTISGGNSAGGIGMAYSEGTSPTHGPVSDTRSDNPLVDGRPQSGEIEPLGAMGPAVSGNRGDINRGPSNASSSYSAANRSDGSGEVPGSHGTGQYYNGNNQYDAGNPYSPETQYGSPPGRAEMGGQPIIRDVQARRNTRIENPAHFPQQSAGISQNF